MKWIFIILLLSGIGLHAEEYMPSHILQLDPFFSHHALLVEKSTHSLHLFENQNGFPKLIKSYNVATGKIRGNKFTEGDHKTPEGIYQLSQFLSKEQLSQMYAAEDAKIYGAGAFTSNYPNEIDRRKGKSGGGIWLHSTNDDSRINKGLDSRGCVVVVDKDLKDLSQYIDLQHTTMIIVQDINYLTKKTWEKNRKEALEAVEKWGTAWKNKDFNSYIEQYNKTEFIHPVKGRYNEFKAYKKSLFDRSEKPDVNIDHISIMTTEDYAVAIMRQKYRSDLVNDTGKKILFLKKDEHYDWKIISEHFFHMPEEPNLAFTPSMRFFK